MSSPYNSQYRNNSSDMLAFISVLVLPFAGWGSCQGLGRRKIRWSSKPKAPIQGMSSSCSCCFSGSLKDCLSSVEENRIIHTDRRCWYWKKGSLHQTVQFRSVRLCPGECRIPLPKSIPNALVLENGMHLPNLC